MILLSETSPDGVSALHEKAIVSRGLASGNCREFLILGRLPVELNRAGDIERRMKPAAYRDNR